MKYIRSVYVASSSADIDRAERWMGLLAKGGLAVTSTWPKVVRTVGDANPREATMDQRCGWASCDLAEVKACDLLWFLVPAHEGGHGAFYETGYADALDKVSVFSGDTKKSIFTARGHEFADDTEAFAWILRMAKDGY